MSITMSFNQMLAAILVGMLAILLITVIVLASKLGKTTKKVDNLVDETTKITETVNGAVSDAADSFVRNITAIQTVLTTSAIVIIIVEADRKLRGLYRKTKKK